MALLLIKSISVLLFAFLLAGRAFSISVLSAIGAGSIPLFAACMVQDWDLRTKPDRGRYVGYLSAMAVLGCVGTGLLLQPSLSGVLDDAHFSVDFRYPVMAVLIPGFYLLFCRNWRKSVPTVSVLSAALALPGIVLKMGGFYILSGYVSLFHSMALCAGILYLWFSAKSRSEGLGWGLLLGPAILLYIVESRFGLWFAVLFFILYACRRLPVWADVIAIFLWSCVAFGVVHRMMFSCGLAGCLLFLQDVPMPVLSENTVRRWNRVLLASVPAAYLSLLLAGYVFT